MNQDKVKGLKRRKTDCEVREGKGRRKENEGRKERKKEGRKEGRKEGKRREKRKERRKMKGGK